MRRLVGSVLMVLSVALLTAACAEDIPEIYIVGNQYFTDSCQVPPPGSGTDRVSRGRGTLDLFIANSYVMAPRVENTLVESESVEFRSGRGGQAGGLEGTEWEANNILLERANVTFDVPEGLGVTLPPLDIAISGAISPGKATSIDLQIINSSLVQVLATSRLLRDAGVPVTITANIKFSGKTSAGRTVGSNEFIYPIELCYGCLVDFPTAAMDPDITTKNCRNTASYSEVENQRVCHMGQDEMVDCRMVCPQRLAQPDGDPMGICEPLSFF